MKIRVDNGRSVFAALTEEMIGAWVVQIKVWSKVSTEKISHMSFNKRGGII